MEVISLRLWAASGQWLLHIRVRLYLFGMNREYVYINAYPVYPQALTLYCTDHVVHPFVNWKYSQVLRGYSGTIQVLFTHYDYKSQYFSFEHTGMPPRTPHILLFNFLPRGFQLSSPCWCPCKKEVSPFRRRCVADFIAKSAHNKILWLRDGRALVTLLGRQPLHIFLPP